MRSIMSDKMVSAINKYNDPANDRFRQYQKDFLDSVSEETNYRKTISTLNGYYSEEEQARLEEAGLKYRANKCRPYIEFDNKELGKTVKFSPRWVNKASSFVDKNAGFNDDEHYSVLTVDGAIKASKGEGIPRSRVSSSETYSFDVCMLCETQTQFGKFAVQLKNVDKIAENEMTLFPKEKYEEAKALSRAIKTESKASELQQEGLSNKSGSGKESLTKAEQAEINKLLNTAEQISQKEKQFQVKHSPLL